MGLLFSGGVGKGADSFGRVSEYLIEVEGCGRV